MSKSERKKSYKFNADSLLDSVLESSMLRQEGEIGPLDGRDRFYTAIVHSYVDYYQKKSKNNLTLRNLFFWFSFGLLLCVIAGMILSVVFLCKSCDDMIAMAVGIVASFAGTVASILILPKIIGKYLFPPNEDKHMRELLYHMRTADEYRITKNGNYDKGQSNQERE